MEARLIKYSVIGLAVGLGLGLLFDKVGLFSAFGFAIGVGLAVFISGQGNTPKK